MNDFLTTGILLLTGVAILIVAGLFGESRDWHGGYCRVCGGAWGYFDTDSQGGRGYCCEGGHVIWISYPLDGNRARES